MMTTRALLAIPLLLFPLLAAAPASADDPPGGFHLRGGAGFAWLSRSGGGVHEVSPGVALEIGLDGPVTPQVEWSARLTWGLTDWDRAREYIDAGNRAGAWTTDEIERVDRWRRASPEDEAGLRTLAAFFAYIGLGATYVAVPTCYTASVFGATSHVQLDATMIGYLSEDAPINAWGEVGFGAVALPEAVHGSWSRSTTSRAAGPVVGGGVLIGKARLGARLLWSPPAFTTSTRGATVLIGAVTLGGSI